MSTIATNLLKKHCQPCAPGSKGLGTSEINKLIAGLPGWSLADGKITRTFNFKNYYETMAFVNALAWVSHREDHHPDLEVGYNKCRVQYSTHSVGGLSENDFICAAKANALMDDTPNAR